MQKRTGKLHALCALILSIAMVFTMMPQLSGIAYADEDPVIFTVYSSVNNNPKVVKTYTKSQLEAVGGTGQTGQSYLWYKSGGWAIYGATKYVTIPQIIKDSGVTVSSDDAVYLDLSGEAADQIPSDIVNGTDKYYFYPNTGVNTQNTTGAVQVVSCIATEWAEAAVTTTAQDAADTAYAAAATAGNSPRFLYGSTEADYTAQSGTTVAGKRSVSGVDGIVVSTWTENPCTLTYMANDATYDTETVNEGKTAVLPAANPTKDGDTFAYWYYKDGDKEVKVTSETVVRTNITIYAKWTSELETGGVWNGTADTSWYNTTDKEFTITTAEQLAGIAQIVNGTATGIAQDSFAGRTIKLASDLKLNEKCYSAKSADAQTWTPIGTMSEDSMAASSRAEAVYAFEGTFDGQGHKIENMYTCSPGTDYFDPVNLWFSLFRANKGTIKYISVSGYAYAGRMSAGIAAYNAGTIIGCHNDCTVVGNGSSTRPSGGICSYNAGCVAYCYNTGDVSNPSGTAAGIVGNSKADNSMVYGCFNSGSIDPTTDGRAGTIAAADCESTDTPQATVENCYWLPVSGNTDLNAVSTSYAANTTAYRIDSTGKVISKQVNATVSEATSNDPATIADGINKYGDYFSVSGSDVKLFWEAGLAEPDTNIDVTTLTADNAEFTVDGVTEGKTSLGSKVTVTATPSEKYIVKSFTVKYKDKSGTVIKTKNIETGAASPEAQSITLYPVSNVEISAETELQSIVTVKVNPTSILNKNEETTVDNAFDIVITDQDGNVIKDGDQVKGGTVLNLDVKIKDGVVPADKDYKYVNRYYVTVSNATVVSGSPNTQWTVNSDDSVPAEISVGLFTIHKTWDDATSIMDTSWYSDDADEYTISTPQQLIGFSYLVNVKGITFEGKKVNLDSDIDMGSISSDVNYWWGGIGRYTILTDYAPLNEELTASNFTTMKTKYTLIYGERKSYSTATGAVQYIQLSAATDVEKYDKFYVGSTFRGTFEGNNHKISGLNSGSLVEDTYSYKGLFGKVVDASISDVTVAGALNGNQNIAGIAGNAKNTTITNCTNQIEAASKYQTSYVGGIVGNGIDGQVHISNCNNEATITGYGYVAGIIAAANSSSVKSGSITDCVNYGDIVCNYPGSLTSAANGGIAGKIGGMKADPYKVTNCVNYGNVTSTSRGNGGIVGDCSVGYTIITYCENSGDIDGTADVGGVLGNGGVVTVTECSSTGNIRGNANYAYHGIGGFAGYCGGSGVFTNCYCTGDIEAYSTVTGRQTCAGGFIGVTLGKTQFKNCYTSGTFTITGTESNVMHSGNFNGFVRTSVGSTGGAATTTNCYYTQNDAFTDESGAISKTPEEMITADFVDELNGEDDAYAIGIGSQKGGYPVFTWQKKVSDEVIELAQKLFPDADIDTLTDKITALNLYEVTKNVNAVKKAIDAIDDPVTKDSGDCITAARMAYDDLVNDSITGAGSAQLLADSGYTKKLSDAEIAYAEAVEKDVVSTIAASVTRKIDAIGEVTVDSQAAIIVARAAYDDAVANETYGTQIEAALADQKTKLEAAEAAYVEAVAKAKEEAEAAAEKAAIDTIVTSVTKKIDAIGEVTTDSQATIVIAREAYDEAVSNESYGAKVEAELTAQKAKLEAAEAAYKEAVAKAQKEADESSINAIVKAVTQKVNAIGTVTADSKVDIAIARAAYDEAVANEKYGAQIEAQLTAQKATLEAAEAAYKEAVAKAQKEADESSINAIVKAVTQKINAIGTVTADSKVDIAIARAAYDEAVANEKYGAQIEAQLTAQKATLEAAEAAYEKVAKDDQEAAKEAAIAEIVDFVADKVSAIGTVTKESQVAIVTARNAYDNAVANKAYGAKCEAQLTAQKATIEAAEKSFMALQLDYATVEIQDTVYNGKVQEQVPVVTNTKGEVVDPEQYIVLFKNTTLAGTADVLITAKNGGIYTGSVTASYKIVPAEIQKDNVTNIQTKVYTGKARYQSLVVTVSGMTLTKETDFTAKYENNIKSGFATVTVIGKGNFTGSVTKSFRIKPAKGKVAKLTTSKKRLTVRIKSQKASGVTGYQIKYRRAGNKTWHYAKTTNLKKTFKKLVRNKFYRVKVRAYTKVNGTTIYGKYSSIASKRIK